MISLTLRSRIPRKGPPLHACIRDSVRPKGDRLSPSEMKNLVQAVAAYSLCQSTNAICSKSAHILNRLSLHSLTQDLVTVEQIVEVDGHSVGFRREREFRR